VGECQSGEEPTTEVSSLLSPEVDTQVYRVPFRCSVSSGFTGTYETCPDAALEGIRRALLGDRKRVEVHHANSALSEAGISRRLLAE
jgi:hypothetical protein